MEEPLTDRSQPSAVPNREIRIRVPKAPSTSTMVALLALGGVVTLAAISQSQLRSLRQEVTALKTRTRDDTSQADRLWRQFEIERVIEGYAPTIDLRSGNLASVGDGFSVGQLTIEAVPGGTKVSGLLVNAQAVSHEGADFKLTAGGQSQEFSVMSLPAGGSARFTAVVTGVSADSVRWGMIKYQRSTVSYRRP